MPRQLAILGGTPLFTRDELRERWPVAGAEEEAALLRVLRGPAWCRLKDADWSDGECGRFEREFAGYLGVPFALAVTNGTQAIDLALLALGIGRGDEVIVQASTFFGSVTPILRVGAVPVFVDIEPDTLGVDPARIEAAITPRTKAVMVVHLAGLTPDLDRVTALCRRHGLRLTEDCAQATGTRWRGRPVGSIGDVGTFSLQQDKTLQAGEGGLVVTSDEAVFRRVFAFHQGFTMPGSPEPAKTEVSSNMRLASWQAAIARCGLARLDDQVDARLAAVAHVRAMLTGDMPVRLVDPHRHVTRWSPSSLPMRYTAERMGGLPKAVFVRALQAEGIPAFEGHFEPLYLRPLFLDNDLRYRNEGCPTSERVAASEYVAVLQPFLLGPPKWMELLVSLVEDIGRDAGKLAALAA
jgi:dTDP-4-amino-4,6-dideoxygalactose transaminase